MATIKIIAGTFGWNHGTYDLVKAGDPPIEVDDALAKRLVEMGVAEYVTPIHEDIQRAEAEPALEDMSVHALRKLGKQYGLNFSTKMTRAEMVEAIKAEWPQEAPEFDATEAVQ